MTTTAVAPRKGRRTKEKANCPDCGAADNRHVSSCSQCETRCTVAMGGVRCEKFENHDPPHAATNAEGDTLSWGYADDPEFENAGAEATTEVTTTVDGVEAKLVIDGSTGEVVDATPVTPNADEIVRRTRAIGRKERELDDARSEKKIASDRVKSLEEEHEMMVRALVRYVNDGEMMLPFEVPKNNPTQAQADHADAVGEEGRDDALSADEQRMLAMAEEAQDENDGGEDGDQTQMLSQTQPGVYVTPEEGGEA